jgi:hypothetical protein
LFLFSKLFIMASLASLPFYAVSISKLNISNIILRE